MKNYQFISILIILCAIFIDSQPVSTGANIFSVVMITIGILYAGLKMIFEQEEKKPENKKQHIAGNKM